MNGLASSPPLSTGSGTLTHGRSTSVSRVILALQRSAGNAAVRELLVRSAPPPQRGVAPLPAPTKALQAVTVQRRATPEKLPDDIARVLNDAVAPNNTDAKMTGAIMKAIAEDPAGRAPLAPGASVHIGLPKPGGAPATGPLVLAGGLDLEMESAGVLRPVSVQAKSVPLRR